MVCPELELSEAFRAVLGKPLVGIVRGGYLAEASDPIVAEQGQTGGFIRALLGWALETGQVDGVVCVQDDPDRPLRPRAVIVTDPAVVLACAKSKYCPVPINELLSRIIKFKGKLAYVGLSCHMQGLQLARDRVAALRDKLAIRIGLFCDRVLNYHAAEFHARCGGVTNRSDIAQFDYRHKLWRGWYGDIRVVTRWGEVRNISNSRRAMSRGVFTCTHCLLCPDKLNVLADISVGDPHGVRQGRQVPSAVLVRTEKGERWFQAAASAGAIRITPSDPEVIARGQHIERNCETATQCARQMQHRHSPLPVFLQSGPLAVGPDTRQSLYARVAVWWSIQSQRPAGVWVMRHLPTCTPLVWRCWLSIRGNLRRAWGLVTRHSRRWLFRRPQRIKKSGDLQSH